MNYFDGKRIEVGDRIELLNQGPGIVVCSIDDGIYSNEFTEDHWSYLETGVLLKMDNGEVIHYPEPDSDLIKK